MYQKITRIFLVLYFLGTGMNQLLACDFCNLYLSIQPNDFQHSLGVQYRFRNYRAIVQGVAATPSLRTEHGGTHVITDSEEDVLVEEAFSSYEIWGRYFIKPEWQLYATLPFAENRLLHDGITQNKVSGIGDLTVLTQYQLYNTVCDTVEGFRQRWLLGGGLKLPTGAYKVADDDDDVIDHQMQPGSGSLDFLLNTNYMARYGRFGVNSNLSFRFNTQNNLDFTFANRFNANVDVFAQVRLGKMTLMPDAGLYFEQAERDVLAGELVEGTGGRVLFSAVGGSVYVGRFSIGLHHQTPLDEQLHDVQLSNRERWILGLSYFIPGS